MHFELTCDLRCACQAATSLRLLKAALPPSTACPVRPTCAYPRSLTGLSAKCAGGRIRKGMIRPPQKWKPVALRFALPRPCFLPRPPSPLFSSCVRMGVWATANYPVCLCANSWLWLHCIHRGGGDAEVAAGGAARRNAMARLRARRQVTLFLLPEALSLTHTPSFSTPWPACEHAARLLSASSLLPFCLHSHTRVLTTNARIVHPVTDLA